MGAFKRWHWQAEAEKPASTQEGQQAVRRLGVVLASLHWSIYASNAAPLAFQRDRRPQLSNLRKGIPIAPTAGAAAQWTPPLSIPVIQDSGMQRDNASVPWRHALFVCRFRWRRLHHWHRKGATPAVTPVAACIVPPSPMQAPAQGAAGPGAAPRAGAGGGFPW